MPLNTRQIAVKIAVLFFFALSFVGWINGLSPFICCKRAVAGAILAYLAATLAVRIINAILINAIITSQLNKQRENTSGDSD
jgi:hypothetical protein